MKFLNKKILFIAIPFFMVACSKLDVSGIWIPEKFENSEKYYEYYEIGQKDSLDRYSFTKYIYITRSNNPRQKLPLLNGKIEKKLEFNKDNTYCVEGSMQTECVIYVDGKLDIYGEGTYVKSSQNPPKIPVNQ